MRSGRSVEFEHASRTRDYLENLIACAGDGIFTLDPAGRVTRWNKGMERILGCPLEDVLGQTVLDLEAAGIFSRAGGLIERAMGGETLEGLEETCHRRDGRRVDAMLTMSPIVDPSGSIEGVSVIVRDVTERRGIEATVSAMHQRILEAESQLLDLVEKAPDAIFLVDAADGRVVQANRMAESVTGLDRARLTGRGVTDLHPESERDAARSQFDGTVATGAGPSVELRLLRAGAAPLDVEVTSGVLTYGGRRIVQWFCRDIGDRKRAQQEKETLQLQLLQSEKLSALGELISGVAHELNNPLTGVIGYSQLLAGIDCDERVRRGLQRVYAEARRCHRVVQNLLVFARKHAPERQYISINEILENTLELQAYQLRVDDITVRPDLSKDLPRTMGDYHQLQQVFVNIINNAHHAMNEAGQGGVLSIRSTLALDRIRVEIADTGPGIMSGDLKKIFDPFFTTKHSGQGTGLGLSICYGIVEEHEGRILVSSGVGRGTVFTIDLPVLGPAQIERSVSSAG
jgi:two-component system NtrC family sensor kinase